MKKSYTQMREDMELNEISLMRTGSTLFFAAQVRNAGQRLETKIGNAKGRFNASQKAKTPEEKLNHMAEGMTEMADAIYLQRVMMGNITGLTLSAALIQKKSDKDITKLLKGKRTR